MGIKRIIARSLSRMSRDEKRLDQHKFSKRFFRTWVKGTYGKRPKRSHT